MENEYIWNMIEEASRKSRAAIPFEEKCSACGLGFAFGCKAYKRKDGSQYAFIERCMEEAIELEREKRGAWMRVESEYSLDKRLGNDRDSASGHDFFAGRPHLLEDIMIFREFMESLPECEGKILKEILRGFDEREIMEDMRLSEKELEDAMRNIRKGFTEYFLE